MRAGNDLGSGRIGVLVGRIALPSMLAQFISVLYSIVDRIFIGQIPGEGALALAGAGVCGPVVTMVGSVAFLVGVGGAPLLSIKRGEGDDDAARGILANCFLMLCVFSLALPAAILPFREPMLRLFGASDATYPYAEAYFTLYLLGTPFALLASGLNQFIVCQGFAADGMKSVVLGAVLNIVLDPVFIFAFGLGVRGAAIATVLSQLASCVYAVRFLLGKKPPIRITRGGYSAAVMRRVLTLGFSPFIIIALDNVMIIAMNAVLQHYGGAARGDALVTCATIAQSFMLVVTMPLGGITGGTQSILSYNYGAYRTERVRQAQKYIFGLGLVFTAVMTLAARLAGPLFVRLFTTDEALAAQAFDTIKVCTLALLPLGLQYEVVDGFTALGLAKLALPLSLWRKAVYFAAVFALPAFFGADAVFYAEPISDVLGPLASVAVYCVCIRGVLARRAALAPQKLPN